MLNVELYLISYTILIDEKLYALESSTNKWLSRVLDNCSLCWWMNGSCNLELVTAGPKYQLAAFL